MHASRQGLRVEALRCSPRWLASPPLDRFRSEFVGINLGQLQQWIDAGRLSPEGKITMATLQQSGLSSRLTKTYEKGIKLLAGGSEFFAAKLDLEVPTSLFHHLLSASGRLCC